MISLQLSCAVLVSAMMLLLSLSVIMRELVRAIFKSNALASPDTSLLPLL